MFSRMQDLLQWRANLLLEGRVEDLARQYIFPYAAYLEQAVMVVPSLDQALEVLTAMHSLLVERRVYRIATAVTAVELPRAGRFRVWAQTTEYSHDPAFTLGSQAVHFMRCTVQGTQTEMVEYIKNASCALLHPETPQRRIA